VEGSLVQARIGRWEVGPDGDVTLFGNHCRNCGEVTFPEREFCPRCRSNDLAATRLVGPARLLSYTIVHQAPAGFPTPTTVGYGVFEGDAVVLAPIDAPSEALHKGMSLRVTEGQTSVAFDGTPFISYRFEAIADA
jgi:uncharacterized OB-fold protein